MQGNHAEAFRTEIMTVMAVILSEQFLTLGTVTGVFHIVNLYVSPQLPKLVTTAVCSFFSEDTKAAKD